MQLPDRYLRSRKWLPTVPEPWFLCHRLPFHHRFYMFRPLYALRQAGFQQPDGRRYRS
ncbi:hypothetical protein EVA_20163 [gut metagenome]|uniref:Uncharacterized protein n=1 Tax=gut metagenome TaxID=749906 RepID=J9BVY7_9ZZZZ